MSNDDETRKALYKKLEEVVQGFTELENRNSEITLYSPSYVLAVGYEGIDDEGDTFGPVAGYPKDGCQAAWKIEGILSRVLSALDDDANYERDM